jgi:hypothetical protein
MKWAWQMTLNDLRIERKLSSQSGNEHDKFTADRPVRNDLFSRANVMKFLASIIHTQMDLVLVGYGAASARRPPQYDNESTVAKCKVKRSFDGIETHLLILLLIFVFGRS